MRQATPQERQRYWGFASGKTQAQWNKEMPRAPIKAMDTGLRSLQ
jgi:hypothetical protein